MKKYLYMITLLMAMVLAGCSDDDSYEAAEALKSDCQQVHFSADNTTKSLLYGSDASKTLKYKVVRNTKNGTLTVPVALTKATAGVTAAPSVTFSDGDSVAYAIVNLPDTAKEGDSFAYTLTLSGDEVDPYSTLLDGGISYTASAVYPTAVNIQFYYLYSDYTNYTDYWTDKAYDLGGGEYQIPDFAGSGHPLIIHADGSKGIAYPELAEENKDNAYDLYSDDYGSYIGMQFSLYPWGADGMSLSYVYLLVSQTSGYSSYDSSTKTGWMYVYYMQTSTGKEDYWGSLNFTIK
ncbi:MAG: hypothetical protein PUD15_09220 [Prevotella sp.]|nr:hypothetical protein [Prevotella sp.]